MFWRCLASSGSIVMSATSWIILLFSTIALCSPDKGLPASTLTS